MDRGFTSSSGGSDRMDILQEAPVTLICAADQVTEDVPEEFGGYVLIVGPDSDFREYYQDIFLRLGFSPLVVTSYESALAALRLIIFEFMVVPQSRLPFEGRFVMEDEWRYNDRTCILVITKGNDPGRRQVVSDIEALDYLRDPVAVPEMLHTITAHLQTDAIRQGALRRPFAME